VPFEHSIWPAGQPQALLVQTWVAPQTLPHMPQLAAFDVTSTQFEPHSIWPAVGQPQLPFVHAWPAEH